MNPLQLMELAKIHQQEIQRGCEHYQPTWENKITRVTDLRLLKWLVIEAQAFFVKLSPKQLQESA